MGTHGAGALRSPVPLPFEGDGYAVPGPWRGREANYGTEELVGAVTRAARRVEGELPGGTAAVGDLSHRSGGGSPRHKSHHSGRDVDVFFYAIERDERPVRPGDAMIHFGPNGRATRWSPPHGVRPPPRPIPDYRFDARRNWAFVRALLSDLDVEVQWIFIHRSLAAALLREAVAAGDDPAIVARAAFIMHQPSDAEPHSDHMHIRVYCSAGDRSLGCVDRGPVRWWKKMWKYMEAPFGRAPSDTNALERIEALGRLFRGEVPLWFIGDGLTS